jgi:hypothetical protein
MSDSASSFSGNIAFIQMAATHLLTFQLKNNLPVKDSQFDSRIVVKMPSIMTMAAGTTPSVRNMDGKFLGAKIAVETAESGCDSRVCFALTHSNIGDIPGGSTLSFRISGTTN